MEEDCPEVDWVVNPRDREWVESQIGRPAAIPFRIACRSREGDPIVIELAPYDLNGTPQSNWFWLVDRRLVVEVSRIESRGGVRQAECSVSAPSLALANLSYRSARAGLRHLQGRGVGGARAGVKCLHAHVAFHLAGGFSPIGIWTIWQLYRSDGAILDRLGGLQR